MALAQPDCWKPSVARKPACLSPIMCCCSLQLQCSHGWLVSVQETDFKFRWCYVSFSFTRRAVGECQDRLLCEQQPVERGQACKSSEGT